MPDPIYGTPADLASMGLPPDFLANVPLAAQNAALSVRSRWADSYLRSQFTLPLLAWGDDLTFAVVSAASYDVAVRRGYNPAAGADDNIRERYKDAMRWMERVASGALVPAITDSTSGAQTGVTADGPQVSTGSPRGWSSSGGCDEDWGFRNTRG